MSEEDTRAVVSRWFSALDEGDIDTAMKCLDDNVRWINSPAETGKPGGIPGLSAIIPWLGDFSNKADVMATFKPWGERQETIQYERLNTMFKDDQALVLVHEAARIKATGLVYDVEFVQRIQVKGNVIVLLKAYWDTSQAVRAFRGDMPSRLRLAVRHGNINEAELILPFGANPNQVDPVSTESVLMIAAEGDCVEMVKLLLSYGAEPNLVSRKTGRTALHNACRAGKSASIKALLEAGAFVNLQCPTTGESPLREAQKSGFLECAEILIEAGANEDVIDNDLAMKGTTTMTELKDRILDVVKAPCLAGLSTITTDGKPWVRYVIVEASNDLTFRCSSFADGRKVAQLASNPEAHLTCGIGGTTDMGPYLQIQGRAEFKTDPKTRHAFWSDRLSHVFKGPDDPSSGVVVFTAYRIELCKVGSKPEVWER